MRLFCKNKINWKDYNYNKTINYKTIMRKILSIISMFVMALTAWAVDSGTINNTSGGIQISAAAGWNESLYAEWAQYSGATNYNVYVKGGQYSDFTKIDGQLVRSYGTYNRADALGLKAGTNYAIKIVPVVNNAEVASAASTATNIIVKNYNREGYAHYNATAGVGAYNNDGTLKSGARVIYVSKANAKTIQLSMNAGGKSEETRTGIQDILQAYEKGVETRPLAVRIIGQLKMADMPELGSSSIGLQVKGKGQNMNLTIEGVGNDATFHGFGVLVRACKYVELRNFAVMMHAEDGISFDTDNEHVWGHNLDIFYGQNKGGDKAKGDGSFDVKGTFYCTVAANHFWDSGKCNLNSNGDEVDYVTYVNNWYDHSDSRHPRVRKSKHLHVYNNYFDGNSKYGVGSTTGSCIFVEKNYFRNCKYPMLISLQGSDIHNGVGSKDETKGTFSSESGGIIKAFDNYMTGQNSFEPYVAGHATYSKHFDAYVASSRNEPVPSSVVALSGGSTYNNFDSASDFYSYSPLAPADVPAFVTGQYGAGRMQGGDFKWTFNNSTEDTNYDVISELSSALSSYTGKLVKVYGDMGAESGEEGGEGGEGGDDPTPTPDPTPAPEGDVWILGDNVPSGYKVDGSASVTKYAYSSDIVNSSNLFVVDASQHTVTIPAGYKVTSATLYAVNDNNSDNKGKITEIAGKTFDVSLKSRKGGSLAVATASDISVTGSLTFTITYKSGVKLLLNVVSDSATAIEQVANVYEAETSLAKKAIIGGKLVIIKNGKFYNAAGALVK